MIFPPARHIVCSVSVVVHHAYHLIYMTAAKNALRRKKVHEKSLEQTTAQILQLESQIYSIEAANINQETLAAMKNAGKAMKQIHKGMSIEMVDQTMYVAVIPHFPHTLTPFGVSWR